MSASRSGPSTARLVWLLVSTIGTATIVFTVPALVFVSAPQIGARLKASQTDVVWISVAYPLMVASLLLPVGLIVDHYGRRRGLVGGIAVMCLGLILAATAGSSGGLIAGLLVAGIGGGTAFPCTLATITVAAPDDRRGVAVGMWAAAVPLGGVVGTLVGGIAIQLSAEWETGFVVVAVLAALTGLVAVVAVPETRDPREQPFDALGALLSTIGVAGLVISLTEGPVHGWGSATTLLYLGVAAVALTAFVIWEARTATPLLDVRLFLLPGFGAAAGAIFATFFALYLIVPLIFQYEAYTLGYTPLRGAFGILPLAITMLPTAVAGPTVARRRGPKFVITTSLAIGVLAGTAFASIGSGGGWAPIAISLIILGASVGLCAGPVTEIITEQLPAAKQGVASAVNNLTRELGATLGIAIGGTAFNIGYRHQIDHLLHPGRDPIAAIIRNSPAAGLQAAGHLGARAHSYLAAIHSGVNIGWTIAMSTVAVAYVLTLAFFAWRFPTRSATPTDHSPGPRNVDPGIGNDALALGTSAKRAITSPDAASASS
jgi:MFS family permease